MAKPSPFRQADPRSTLASPPVREVVWLVSWLDGNLRRTSAARAQTAHQAWQQIAGAPHFSACRVRLGAR